MKCARCKTKMNKHHYTEVNTKGKAERVQVFRCPVCGYRKETMRHRVPIPSIEPRR